jgi:hypothetical protein
MLTLFCNADCQVLLVLSSFSFDLSNPLLLDSNSVFSLKTLNTDSQLPLSMNAAIVDQIKTYIEDCVVNAVYLPPPADALTKKITLRSIHFKGLGV